MDEYQLDTVDSYVIQRRFYGEMFWEDFETSPDCKWLSDRLDYYGERVGQTATQYRLIKVTAYKTFIRHTYHRP